MYEGIFQLTEKRMLKSRRRETYLKGRGEYGWRGIALLIKTMLGAMQTAVVRVSSQMLHQGSPHTDDLSYLKLVLCTHDKGSCW